MTEASLPSWAEVREGVCHIGTEDINIHHLAVKWLGLPRLCSKPFLQFMESSQQGSGEGGEAVSINLILQTE